MPRTEQPGTGRAVFSIELELAIDRASLDRQQRMELLAGQLLDCLDEQGIGATWAVADPPRSAATAAILGSGGQHEIAVLGDRSWIGPGAGRPRVQRELARRFDGARRAGMAAKTLVLKNVVEPLDLELLLAQDIQAVSYSGECGRAPLAAAALHYGVWQAPAAWRLPLAPCWWRPLRRQARRRLWDAMTQQRTLHIAIDGDALVDQAPAGLAQIQAVVQEAVCLHAQGKIQFSTLGKLAAGELSARSATPTRSLLKPAA